MRTLVSVLLLVCATAATANPDLWRGEWPRTDFAMTSVQDWSQIRSGGPPRDGIPALSDPAFLRASDTSGLGATEPVLTVELPGARPRAYPIRYLIWHEIVNDRIGNRPVAITYCPLCNSALVFDRRTDHGVLGFGVTGKLRHSDMVMYDRETESWWQQATGEAIVGRLTGMRLQALPAWMESWALFRERNPDGLVMAEPNYNRDYGRNPYTNYDRSKTPFLYRGDPPPHGLRSLSRVVAIGDRAWPLQRLADAGEIVEDGVRLTWRAGQASALGAAEIERLEDREQVLLAGEALEHIDVESGRVTLEAITEWLPLISDDYFHVGVYQLRDLHWMEQQLQRASERIAMMRQGVRERQQQMVLQERAQQIAADDVAEDSIESPLLQQSVLQGQRLSELQVRFEQAVQSDDLLFFATPDVRKTFQRLEVYEKHLSAEPDTSRQRQLLTRIQRLKGALLWQANEQLPEQRWAMEKALQNIASMLAGVQQRERIQTVAFNSFTQGVTEAQLDAMAERVACSVAMRRAGQSARSRAVRHDV